MSSLLFIDELLAAHGFSWKYYTSLAMFSHTARDVGKKLYETWCKEFGALSAKHSVKRLFPRAVSQRWGRLHELERRVLDAGPYKLAKCLLEILMNKPVDSDELAALPAIPEETTLAVPSSANGEDWGMLRKQLACAHSNSARQTVQADDTLAPKQQTSTASQTKQKHIVKSTPDELEIEQTKAYSVKMGLWRSRTLLAVTDLMWSRVVEIMHRLGSPVVHLSNFVKRVVPDDELQRVGGALAQLVTGKAMTIFREYTFLARDWAQVCKIFHCLFILP